MIAGRDLWIDSPATLINLFFLMSHFFPDLFRYKYQNFNTFTLYSMIIGYTYIHYEMIPTVKLIDTSITII